MDAHLLVGFYIFVAMSMLPASTHGVHIIDAHLPVGPHACPATSICLVMYSLLA